MTETSDRTDPRGTPTTVETSAGRFSALVDGGVVRIRNVRYAAAGRFEAPRPVDPDPAESADKQHLLIACPQPPSLADQIYGPQLDHATFDEDCLRLTITRPQDLAPDEELPVLVWVHGGAYVSGAGDLTGYDPAALVREHRLLVVAVTYRLGALGFFGSGPGDDTRPGNLGLLDLITALRWVRDHVGTFGGDPEAVTVMGQSAGADLVAHVLGADGAEGLVRRAVLQSAPLGIRGGREAITARMRDVVGAMGPAAPVDAVLAAQARAAEAVTGMNDRAGMPFAPEYGVAPLAPQAELEATWRQRAPGVDLLVTWDAQDGEAFVELDPKGRALRSKPVYGKPLRRVIARKVTDSLFRKGAIAFARDLAAAGARVTTAELTTRVPGNHLGATHAVELGLLFPHARRWADAPIIGPEGAATALEAGRGLRAAWAEFVRTGQVRADRVPAGAGWHGELRVRTRS